MPAELSNLNMIFVFGVAQFPLCHSGVLLRCFQVRDTAMI